MSPNQKREKVSYAILHRTLIQCFGNSQSDLFLELNYHCSCRVCRAQCKISFNMMTRLCLKPSKNVPTRIETLLPHWEQRHRYLSGISFLGSIWSLLWFLQSYRFRDHMIIYVLCICSNARVSYKVKPVIFLKIVK